MGKYPTTPCEISIAYLTPEVNEEIHLGGVSQKLGTVTAIASWEIGIVRRLRKRRMMTSVICGLVRSAAFLKCLLR